MLIIICLNKSNNNKIQAVLKVNNNSGEIIFNQYLYIFTKIAEVKIHPKINNIHLSNEIINFFLKLKIYKINIDNKIAI
ncbi:MAG: hypothetical protein OQL19_12290, partial [Gammaproteobacteria bacterium]|nr:hypothetical protein [Gammaproteobacteria bacterium]